MSEHVRSVVPDFAFAGGKGGTAHHSCRSTADAARGPSQPQGCRSCWWGIARSTEPILITADSDVLLGKKDLPSLVSLLWRRQARRVQRQQVGIAFAAPSNNSRGRAGSAVVGAGGGSVQNFMALYGLYRLIGGCPSMAERFLAISRRALLDIGGLQEVRTILGEDHELARRLCAAGYSVEQSRSSPLFGWRTIALWGDFTGGRWLMVVRAQRPLCF